MAEGCHNYTIGENMIQLQDSELDTKEDICSVQVKQNDEHIDWGDYACLVFYQKNSDIIKHIRIPGLNSKAGTGDRIIFRRTAYDITDKTENTYDVQKNEMESSFLKLEDMGIPIEKGIRVPVNVPLSLEDQHFVDKWVGVWTRNIARNYDRILQGETIIAIRNRCEKAPAVIVGAGPSLDKNIDELKNINAIIISTDRAYKALLARGINPDLVVSVDTHDEHILKYLNRADSSEHILAMNTAGDWRVARMWHGRILYYNMAHKGIQFCDRVLPEMLHGFPAVANVGCVANTACLIAHWMGCKPLIFVGCDFSYPGEKMSCDTYDYVSGVFQKIDVDEKERFKKRSGKVKVNDTYTYPPFLEYMKTIKTLDKVNGYDIVNATEGGILKDIPKLTLRKAKEKYCSESIKGFRENLRRR